jgi:hypothetical protein
MNTFSTRANAVFSDSTSDKMRSKMRLIESNGIIYSHLYHRFGASQQLRTENSDDKAVRHFSSHNSDREHRLQGIGNWELGIGNRSQQQPITTPPESNAARFSCP